MKTSVRNVIVLGGTGFLGQRVVRRLQDRGCPVSAGTRAPDAAASYRSSWDSGVGLVRVDLADPDVLARALEGASAVVNCIGFYAETRQQSFQDVHAEAARRIARLARDSGVQRLVHISGIGASLQSPSAYVRARAEGEAAVRSVCPGAIILRPSVMFSRSGAFFGDLQKIVDHLPVIPLFGNGRTRLQPVWAGDVAEAVCRILDGARVPRKVFELGGPDVFTYREILRRLAARSGRRRLLLPVPFALWRAGAAPLSLLPRPPVTQAQIALMEHDNTAGETMAGFADLGITPQSAIAMGLV
ncbi:complex I NDUFA9 subunit family protein [Leisingera caerulea]|uniref:complex I NDUFA9 subunit family protein n=1 Tax=Leisingera caerulea TaxID=506591 RepID=UPI0021A5A483|nr:complex I NDUFA9 subunit family protein [Leisingera caerulea]UWQ52108.1 complex I NDUFA9 subunit family protein [Leisingera caerulea]UWQ85743.1 complex I NDUFA9 subunit family protein [Leisingera caerulea]